MKQFTLELLIIIVVLIAVLASSCANTSKGEIRDKYGDIQRPTVWRARVLENRTITYVNIPADMRDIYRPCDTVWVNLTTHMIDDTAENTMQCTIYK